MAKIAIITVLGDMLMQHLQLVLAGVAVVGTSHILQGCGPASSSMMIDSAVATCTNQRVMPNDDNLPNQPISGTQSECIAACRAESACVAFSWPSGKSSTTNQQCYLKSSWDEVTALENEDWMTVRMKESCDSAAATCTHQNVMSDDHNLPNQPMSGTQAACIVACRAESACVAFSWPSGASTTTNQKCYLKSTWDEAAAVENEDWTTIGMKESCKKTSSEEEIVGSNSWWTCHHDNMRICGGGCCCNSGHNYNAATETCEKRDEAAATCTHQNVMSDDHNLPNQPMSGTQAACIVACRADSACVAFSWPRGASTTTNQKCYLKSAWDEAAALENEDWTTIGMKDSCKKTSSEEEIAGSNSWWTCHYDNMRMCGGGCCCNSGHNYNATTETCEKRDEAPEPEPLWSSCNHNGPGKGRVDARLTKDFSRTTCAQHCANYAYAVLESDRDCGCYVKNPCTGTGQGQLWTRSVQATPTPALAADGQCCSRNDPAENGCGKSGDACADSANAMDCQNLPAWYNCEWRASPQTTLLPLLVCSQVEIAGSSWWWTCNHDNMQTCGGSCCCNLGYSYNTATEACEKCEETQTPPAKFILVAGGFYCKGTSYVVVDEGTTPETCFQKQNEHVECSKKSFHYYATAAHGKRAGACWCPKESDKDVNAEGQCQGGATPITAASEIYYVQR